MYLLVRGIDGGSSRRLLSGDEAGLAVQTASQQGLDLGDAAFTPPNGGLEDPASLCRTALRTQPISLLCRATLLARAVTPPRLASLIARVVASIGRLAIDCTTPIASRSSARVFVPPRRLIVTGTQRPF